MFSKEMHVSLINLTVFLSLLKKQILDLLKSQGEKMRFFTYSVRIILVRDWDWERILFVEFSWVEFELALI